MRTALLAMVLLLASLHGGLADDSQRFLYLLPDGFTGWVCVDFGVAGAPALPREGDRLVIRPGQEGTIKTSDRVGSIPPTGEARIEVDGHRRPLPKDVHGRRMSSHRNTNDPVERQCVFFGTEDAADAAGDAPGLEDPRMARGVPSEEREALLALYQASNGAQWRHRVGWPGPPGTECQWHGVGCDLRSAKTTAVTRLDLSSNNLVGTVPKALEQLTHLESLFLFGNQLAGTLPEAMLQRWLEGSLEIYSDASLVTSVSEIELESEATALLCMGHRITLRSDQSAKVYTKRCRNKTPSDRATYCEVKSGRIFPTEFGRLGLLLERNGFFGLRPEYSRMVSDSGGQTTRVTRGGGTFQVKNYATAGPMGLWSMQRAIEGVATMVEWESVTSQPECPISSPMP